MKRWFIPFFKFDHLSSRTIKTSIRSPQPPIGFGGAILDEPWHPVHWLPGCGCGAGSLRVAANLLGRILWRSPIFHGKDGWWWMDPGHRDPRVTRVTGRRGLRRLSIFSLMECSLWAVSVVWEYRAMRCSHMSNSLPLQNVSLPFSQAHQEKSSL